LTNYEQENFTLDDYLSVLRSEMMKSEKQTTDISKEFENLKRHALITELDRNIVTSLIQSIHISEPTIVDGEKTYKIDIKV
jgi:hypothetical protein